MTYENLKKIYTEHFSLGHLNTDINSKFALISLICYLTERIKAKKPDVTCYQIVYKLANDIIPEDQINSLSVICSDFAYGCHKFPTFGIEDKNIPATIREILSNWLPF